MIKIIRKAASKITQALERGESVLFLGPRQTGKTTLLKQINCEKYIDLADPRVRLRYEKNPGVVINEIAALEDSVMPLVIIDEVQKVPLLMDSAQYCIDNGMAKFVLTGSSARKLKRDNEMNLLPGRVIPIHLDALMLNEIPDKSIDCNDLLIYGSLPKIILTKDSNEQEELLQAYVITYLEEEVRKEAIVRNLGDFARFLELAAAESGYVINVNKLSQRVGVSFAKIESYLQILEDCLLIERISPISESKTRHRLAKTSKYLFYDLGVRRVAAREGTQLPEKHLGHLFEQLVGIELVRMARLQNARTRIRYWKDMNGPEVDWVIEQPQKLIPIEVKLNDAPSLADARHLKVFLDEYKQADTAYVVCQTPHRMKLANNIYAIPWQEIDQLFITA